MQLDDLDFERAAEEIQDTHVGSWILVLGAAAAIVALILRWRWRNG